MSKIVEPVNGAGDNSAFQNVLPLYPDFNDKIAELSSDMASDWISILLSENRERIHNVNETFRMFVEPKTVQYLFTICLRMRLPHDVKYIALGIFSEFMVAHVNGLYNMIYELPNWTVEQKLKEWEKVETNVSRQLTLRIISCIQIASKIHCYNESLSTKRVKRCLQYLGLAYTEDAICRSELRVLMTLQFSAKSRHSPVTYIESLLSIMNKKFNNQSINIIKLWEYSLLFLDCVFLKLDDIYKRILLVIHGNERAYFQKDHIFRIQADYMLLATGVISAACICVYGMEFTEKKVIDTLSELSLIKSTDILDVSTGIMKTVLEHQKSVSNFSNEKCSK